MSSKTLNAVMLEKFEEDVLRHMELIEWHDHLAEVNDMLTGYLLADDNFIGNTNTSSTIYYLRHLRDFFKNLDDLAH